MSTTNLRLVYLVCLLFICASFAACNNVPSLSKAQPAPSQDAAQNWIKQHAMILKTTDPQATLDDLLPLKPLIGSSSLIGLGEETHGSHEFFTMKHRLLEFLVERIGFTMFAWKETGVLGSRSIGMSCKDREMLQRCYSSFSSGHGIRRKCWTC
jgi:hypothetical protein